EPVPWSRSRRRWAPRRSAAPQRRRWRPGCRRWPAAVERWRSCSSPTGWCPRATPKRWRLRSAGARAALPRARAGASGSGRCALQRRSPRHWRGSTRARWARKLAPVPDTGTALITGIAGQDGSFLAEELLAMGYTVTGMVHAGGDGSLGCSEHLRGRLRLIEGELLAPDTLREAIGQVRPQEIYHLAGPSFVPASWERPADTFAEILGATTAILTTVRELLPSTRVFHAASGAMFGDTAESPQSEDTPMRPETPYAVAKVAAHQLTGVMRAHDGLHASSGILFNHES